MTGTDEDNLVACQIAKREFGVNRTVARASNPKNRGSCCTPLMGVDTVVCGTDNLSHILEREIETDTIRQLLSLGGGTASLNEILLPEDLFAGKAIKDVPIPGDAILVSITRDTEFIIPHGNTSAALGPHPGADSGRYAAPADRGLGAERQQQVTERELRRTALIIPPRGRAVLCCWTAIPGLLAAPFVFWQSLPAGVVFCLLWAALVAVVYQRACSYAAALGAETLTVYSGIVFPLRRAVRRAGP